ncbi:MAG: hypothetical protein WCC10_11295, partial [Tumebacillaceae bacterium]
MCYYMTLISKTPIEEKMVEQYLREYDIYLSDTTKLVKAPLSGRFYTQILRGCSCDFVSQDPSKNQINILKDLYKSALQKDGEIMLACIYDDNSYGDIGVDLHRAIDLCPTRHLSFAEFLSLF